jgi:hypothetical protein
LNSLQEGAGLLSGKCAGECGIGCNGFNKFTQGRMSQSPHLELEDVASAAGEMDLELISIIYICDDLIIW